MAEKYTTNPNEPKDAIVMSSGGAEGAYSVGVIKALFTGQSPVTGYRPLDPAIFTGSSIGAFNASFLVSRLGETDIASAITDLEQVWLEDISEDPSLHKNSLYRFRANISPFLNLRQLLSNPIEPVVHMAKDTAFLSQKALKWMTGFIASDKPLLHSFSSLLDPTLYVSSEPLVQLVQKHIRFENIRNSKKILGITATNWNTEKLEHFSNHDMTDRLGPQIIRASTALPGFFPPVEIGNQTYVDAAVLGYARLHPAMEAGAETLHLIYLDPDTDTTSSEEIQSTLDILYRAFVATWVNRVAYSVETVRNFNHCKDLLEDEIQGGHLTKAKALQILDSMQPSGSYEHAVEASATLRKFTVHRYNPHYDLGGSLGLFDLDRTRIANLIESGFLDTSTTTVKPKAVSYPTRTSKVCPKPEYTPKVGEPPRVNAPLRALFIV